MFRRIANSILVFYREETLKERSERMVPGVIIGIIVGTAYVLIFSTINIISLPALRLSLDWGRMLTNLVIYDLALALVGAAAGWFTDDYMGAIGGGIVTILLYLTFNWIITLFTGGSPTRPMDSFIMIIPLVIAAMLLCGVFRFLIGWYLRITQTAPEGKRRGRLAGFIAIVIVAGMIPGLFSRFDRSSQKIIKTIGDTLQTVASHPAQMAQFPLTEFPDLQNHFGMHFVLYARPSTSEINALDVTIRYDDGYSLTCLFSTADAYVYNFDRCFPGNNVNLP